MILRALTLVGGLAGAAATSQFPEYSQQYLQRLGGAVDALYQVTADFDASAHAVGLTRSAALAQTAGTPFQERRRADMTATFKRYEILSGSLARLEGHGPFMRAYYLPYMRDGQIARATLDVYQPALPLNLAGLIFAGFGFVVAGFGSGLLLRMLAMPFRRAVSG